MSVVFAIVMMLGSMTTMAVHDAKEASANEKDDVKVSVQQEEPVEVTHSKDYKLVAKMEEKLEKGGKHANSGP